MTKTVIGRVSYLNCAPFFYGLEADASWQWLDVSPRQLGEEAQSGKVVAGPMALVDFLRLQDQFERLGSLGIAVRGRCGSALLFSRKPIRQLEGAAIAVTEESSTTACLLRLILERRYTLSPKAYERGFSHDADAVLLIGDEALKFQAANAWFPYEIDLAFEWWLWQHVPFVFAVWAIRKDCDPDTKQRINRTLLKALIMNLTRLEAIAAERAGPLGVPAEALTAYLSTFIYRLSEPEERAIRQFAQLLHDHRLL